MTRMTRTRLTLTIAALLCGSACSEGSPCAFDPSATYLVEDVPGNGFLKRPMTLQDLAGEVVAAPIEHESCSRNVYRIDYVGESLWFELVGSQGDVLTVTLTRASDDTQAVFRMLEQ